MRHLQAGLIALCLGCFGVTEAWADFALAVDCSLNPVKYAAGLRPAVLPVDSNGDGVPDPWLINVSFGEVEDCGSISGIPCYSQHHTGLDYAVNGSGSDSQGREIRAIDNGVVVFSTNGQANPGPKRGGLILLKHVAPPGSRFEIPLYRETFTGKDRSQVTITYLREFTSEIVSYYLHLGDAYVKQGDSVTRGQVIGRTYTLDEKNKEGYKFSPHLHFEIWRRCMANDSDGYEPFSGSDFQSAVNDQLVSPLDIFYANAADRELVRILPVRLPVSGQVTISGANFGSTQERGSVRVTGQPLFSLMRQTWNLPIGAWSDSEIRVNIFQNPLLAPSYLIGPLFFEVRNSDGEQEGAFFYPFKDVGLEDWFASSVTRLWKDGLVEGYVDLGRFLPDEPIARSEFIKILVQAFCRNGCGQAGSPSYTDVKPGDWFYSYVSVAWSLGWLDHSQSQFHPHDSITRAEVVKTIALASNLALAPHIESPYSDVHVTDWFAPYVLDLTEMGVLTGFADGSFRPNRAITRAEAANIVDRVRP